MTEEMENDEKLQILRSFLESGRREQVRNLAKETLSIKAFKKLEPTINKLEERKREPIKNSKKLREYYGIDLFLLETGRNVFDEKLTGDIKTALIVGMTGVGKSTFLNSLVNCIMGVEADDPFRYVIVDDFKSNQSQSVTTEVTTYVIKRQGNMKSNFVLVDVPGIGDTRGIDIDK
jgi:ribosome biogenesis GTPase A